MATSTAAWAGHGAMLAFSALIAGSFSLGGLVANEIAPAALNALRFGLAASLVAVVVALRAGRGDVSLRQSARAPGRYLLLGALMALYFVTMFEGLKTAAPVSAAAVFTLTPVMSAGFGALLLGQIATRRIGLALALGCMGALWVIFRADVSALLAFDVGRGEAIYFVGCVAHALYTPLIKRFNRGEPPLHGTFLTLVSVTLVLCLYGARDLWETPWAALPSIVWIAIAYVALAATALSIWLTQFAALRLPASKVMAYTYLTPTWVLVWEAALGQGQPMLLLVGGIMLTLVALALLLRD